MKSQPSGPPPNVPSPVKVVLVEDKPGVRANWVKLINSLPGFSCVQSCVSGEEALRVIPEVKPGIVLMDIFLPRMSGIECTARLKLLLPKLQILMLTAVEDDELVFMALQAGAVPATLPVGALTGGGLRPRKRPRGRRCRAAGGRRPR